jgi:hypothetical protein
MKSFFVLAVAIGSLSQVYSASAIENLTYSKSALINEKFIKMQVKQDITIGRAIKTIVGHYPQQAASIIGNALDLYPHKYKEIIYAAISAQPTLTQEVVTIALSKGVSSCSSIVETAINADPSYIDFVVTAAAHSTPEELSEIVRIAVLIEPDSADYIVQSLAKEHPSRIVEILTSAIVAVPFVGEYVVESLLAAFPNNAEQVITTAVRESSAKRENVKRIIERAHNSGIDSNKVEAYALNGGATPEELSQVLIRRSQN